MSVSSPGLVRKLAPASTHRRAVSRSRMGPAPTTKTGGGRPGRENTNHPQRARHGHGDFNDRNARLRHGIGCKAGILRRRRTYGWDDPRVFDARTDDVLVHLSAALASTTGVAVHAEPVCVNYSCSARSPSAPAGGSRSPAIQT